MQSAICNYYFWVQLRVLRSLRANILLNMSVIWHMMSCTLVYGYQSVGGSYRLYGLFRRWRQKYSPNLWHVYSNLYGRMALYQNWDLIQHWYNYFTWHTLFLKSDKYRNNNSLNFSKDNFIFVFDMLWECRVKLYKAAVHSQKIILVTCVLRLGIRYLCQLIRTKYFVHKYTW